MTRPMMTGLTSSAPDDEPALQGQLCAAAQNSDAARETTVPRAAVDSAVIDSNLDTSIASNPDSWRVEVAARLERYRTRRKPRTPRYPSLLLPFDAPESRSRSALPPGTESPAVATAPARETDFALNGRQEPAPITTPQQALETSGKVIEFPRSAAIPVFHPSDLADPVFDRDRPRIVEAPEILPPPPALGGMLIEPAQQEAADRRADSSAFASTSPTASIIRRALAALVDGAVLATSVTAFVAIFLRLNPSLNHSLNSGLNLSHLDPLHVSSLNLNDGRGPFLLVFAGAVAGVTVLLWAAYEFLFVVYTGSTPGLRAARLRLAGFDGSPLNRSSRQWRVLASFLSAFSAGLGYFWCVLDENGLCWHDRITRTHVQSTAQQQ
jgi:uncharacterized RDD family membrane protein YckC